MTIADILQVLRDFGFPVFVCLWFMLRIEKRLEVLTGYMIRFVAHHEDDAAPREGIDDQGSATGKIRRGT